MPLTLPYDFSTATSVTGAQLQAQFDAIAALIGSLTAADLGASAGILLSQLEANYEHIDVNLRTSFEWYDTGASWPGGNVVMDEVTLPEVTGATPWVCTAIAWANNDTGGGAGTFRVEYGSYRTGAWVQTGWVCANTTMANAAAPQDTNCGVVTPTGTTYSLAVQAGPCTLRLIATGADAAAMDSTGDTVNVTCRLRRQIATG